MHFRKMTAVALAGALAVVGVVFVVSKYNTKATQQSPSEIAATEGFNFTVDHVTSEHVNPDGTVDVLFSDIRVYSTIEGLANDAPVIVVGEVISKGGSRNLARNPADPTQEADDHKTMSQEYYFQVEHYLKGSGESQILIVYPAYTIRSDGTEFEAPELPLQLGGRYILFLAKNNNNNTYYGIGEPWQFQLVDGRAEARAYDDRHAAPFKGLTEADLVELVEDTLQ